MYQTDRSCCRAIFKVMGFSEEAGKSRSMRTLLCWSSVILFIGAYQAEKNVIQHDTKVRNAGYYLEQSASSF